MEFQQFESVKALIARASAFQVLDLERLIQTIVSQNVAEIRLARRTNATLDARTCPRRATPGATLHARERNGRQRFRCRGPRCRRTYNILTGTAMARARKPELWAQYLGRMTEYLSIRKIVATGIDINHVTVWRWRHRFLNAAANDNTALLSGVIEAAKTFFLQSFKGSRGWQDGKPPENRAARTRGCAAARRGLPHGQVPVLTALDSGGGIFETILPSPAAIEAALDGRIAAGSVLCSDGSDGYEKAADKAGAEHRAIDVPTATPHTGEINPVPTPSRHAGRLGLGRVNAYHGRLKMLINNRCAGVATKYLTNYLGWHRKMARQGFDAVTLLDRALA